MHYIEEVAVPAIRVPSFNRAFLYRFDGLDQKRFEEEQMNVRKVRRSFFRRMGSPKGFGRPEAEKRLMNWRETCRRMEEAIRKKGPWLMGEHSRWLMFSSCRQSTDERSRIVLYLGEGVSGRNGLV